MPGVAVIGDAGGITHSGKVCDAACVAEDGYARHGVAVSVRGCRDGLHLLLTTLLLVLYGVGQQGLGPETLLNFRKDTCPKKQ